MKYKMLHIVIDDKFIDGAISLFETDDRFDNTYIIIGNKRDQRYIKNHDIIYINGENALDYINSYNVVVIHSLPAIPIGIVKNIPKEIIVIWYAWGYDLYEKPYNIIPTRLLGPETKKKTVFIRLKNAFNRQRLIGNLMISLDLKKALRRIDYFSGVFPYEIDLIRKNHTEFKAKTLDFYYGSKDFFIPNIAPSDIKYGKNNIIIGNSANMTGNHLDVLKAIASIGINPDAKVIIPLSYGGYPDYIDIVEKTAEKLAPGQIVSLRKYMPLNDYIELISNCRTAFYVHERQQASDNIFMQLLYGARVYMSETSAAFHYLKSLGLKIYSIQNDLHLLNIEMSEEDILINRKILAERYSSSRLIDRVRIINTELIEVLSRRKCI